MLRNKSHNKTQKPIPTLSLRAAKNIDDEKFFGYLPILVTFLSDPVTAQSPYM